MGTQAIGTFDLVLTICVVVTLLSTSRAGYFVFAMIFSVTINLAIEAAEWIRDKRIHFNAEVTYFDYLG
jgi:hypothetical protein